jgi:nitrogen-specific signal transduction histidine kinase
VIPDQGVAESIRETLFQPFVSAGKENGVGLGLTLAQHVAQEHGGEVRLEKSVPGETVFSILLYKQALEAFGHTRVESVKATRSSSRCEIPPESRKARQELL